VRSYDRGEDDAVTLVTTVSKGESIIERAASNSTRNPSLRRHGLAIAFACEICAGRSELTIAQHKGATLIEWRFLPDDEYPGDTLPDDVFYPEFPADMSK
jgi:hypothetical protein